MPRTYKVHTLIPSTVKKKRVAPLTVEISQGFSEILSKVKSPTYYFYNKS